MVGKNVSESKLQAIKKLKMKTKTEKEFMELIKPPAAEKPVPVSKPLPKKAAPPKKRASSPVEIDEDEDEIPKAKRPQAKKSVAMKKRASSPAEEDDATPSKPAAKKGGWNRPTGDTQFDSA